MEEKKLEKVKGSVTGSAEVAEEDHEEDVVFPGFRFHPTDEELVAFYLRRKVNGKAFSIDIIKQIDIYKYDPWDLPKGSHLGGELDKEWYFFCLRGRKYRNSIRPNRVTGSGFWKATGIDKSIYSSVPAGECIGLKKSLVYYRGSAGRGTKTDWMMHEFRLPSPPAAAEGANTTTTIQEAEIWTICRIFKRNVTYNKKCTQRTEDTKASITGKRFHQYMNYYSTCTTSINSFESDGRDDRVGIINHQPFDLEHHAGLHGAAAAAAVPEIAGTPPSASVWSELDFRDGSWDELGRIMELTNNGSNHN